MTIYEVYQVNGVFVATSGEDVAWSEAGYVPNPAWVAQFRSKKDALAFVSRKNQAGYEAWAKEQGPC